MSAGATPKATKSARESSSAAKRARDASIQSIENGGDNDRGDGGFELTLDREPDRGKAHAKRQQGDEIGQYDAQRHRANSAAARARRIEIFEFARLAAQPRDLCVMVLGARVMARAGRRFLHAHSASIKGRVHRHKI